MANRYWVGGTASWDGTAGTKWALTSGGLGGQAVPTSADDVFFDGASGANTVTIATGNTGAKSINCTGFTGTLAGTAAITVSGSVTLVAGMTYSYTGTLTINATGTITSAGKTFANITVNGSGITVTLADNLTAGATRTFTLTAGTLALSNNTLSTGIFSSSNTNTRAITFGTGQITLTGNNATIWGMTTATNFTYTGTPKVVANYSGSTGTRTFQHGNTAGGAESNSLNFYITAGTDTVTTTGTGSFYAKILDFTGFSGTCSNTTKILYGDLVSSTGMTYSAGSLATTFSGTSGTQTITSSGKTLDFPITVSAGSTLQLGDALNISIRALTVNGTFNTTTSNYSVTAASIGSASGSVITLNASTVTLSGASAINLASGTTVNAGTSTITYTASPLSFNGASNTFYDVTFSSGSNLTCTMSGANTFNNLSFTGRTSVGISFIAFDSNQTINGTFSISASTDATYRTFVRSNALGTTRTLTCAAVSFTDIDFRDITIAGAAAPASGTRLGDCKGNSGITFTAAAPKYWNLAGGGNWSATGWALSSGGSPAANNFPLAQDTCYFEATGLNSGATITLNANWNIGTIDMSARTSNTMTLATGTTSVAVYGNWVNGTGTAFSGTGAVSFLGRTTQSITGAGITFVQAFQLNAGGTLILQDAFTTNRAIAGAFVLADGVLDLNGKTLTLSASTQATFLVTTGSGSSRNITFNGGSIVIAASGLTVFNNTAPTGFTTTAGTGTGSISLTSASAKTFVGGGSTYNCSLNQGGAGALTITGSNTFSDITNTYSATGATTITFTAGTTTTVSSFTASGTSGNVLTLQSSSAGSAATLSDASGTVSVSFCTIKDITATGGATWIAFISNGNTDGGGNTGWIFVGTAYASSISETSTATDAVSTILTFLANTNETSTATDTVDAPGSTFNPSLSETATATDIVAGTLTLLAEVADTLTGSDTVSVTLTVSPSVSETATATDEVSSKFAFAGIILESATATDETSTANNTFNPSLAETSTATDVDSAVGTFNSAVAETTAGADTTSAVYTSNPSVSETATGTDVVSPQNNVNPSVAESATITDAVSPKYNANPSVAETATANDSDSATAVFTPSLSETATATDTPSTANNTFNPSLSETATGTDSPAANWETSSAVSETATATDTTRSAVIFVSALSETATATDLVSALMDFLGQISENGTITDVTLVAPSVFGPQVQEAVAALDSNQPTNSTFNVQLVESATALDSVIGAYLWNLIDDDQNPDWAVISTPQNPGWSIIDDSQDPNWQNISNS